MTVWTLIVSDLAIDQMYAWLGVCKNGNASDVPANNSIVRADIRPIDQRSHNQPPTNLKAAAPTTAICNDSKNTSRDRPRSLKTDSLNKAIPALAVPVTRHDRPNRMKTGVRIAWPSVNSGAAPAGGVASVGLV